MGRYKDKPASPSIPISFATGQSSRPPLSATEDDSEIRTENLILRLIQINVNFHQFHPHDNSSSAKWQ